MRKLLKGLAVIAVIVALLVVAGVATGKIDNPFTKPKPGPKASVTVGQDGGTFTFPGEIVVTVPKGAVTKDTTLTVGGATELRPEDPGPFNKVRSGAVKFDVTLARGDRSDIQPKKPLDVEIPLKGKFASVDEAQFAALYTTSGIEGVYWFVSAVEPNKSDVLRGSLTHLSPKWVTYVDDQALLDSFHPDRAEKDRGECEQQLDTDGGKVKIGGDSRGWSLSDDSPIFACLYEGSDGYVRVGIANRIEYILSVAATDDVRIASSKGNAEEEIVKAFAEALFPNDVIKAYAGVGSELVGSMRVDDLPSTIELRGDPNTFLAEGAWRAVSALVGILTGTTGSENAEMIKQLIDSAALVSCLQDVFADGAISWGDAYKLTFECSDPIVDVLQKYIKLDVFKRAQALANGVVEIYNTLMSSANGIKLQVNGTMRIEVEREINPTLKPFIGDWWAHGGSITINADATGELYWSEGPCDPSSHYTCSGYADLVFKPAGDGKIKAEIVSVRYEKPDGSSYTPSSETGPKKGDFQLLTFENENLLGAQWNDGISSSKWCRKGSPQEIIYLCGG